MSDALTLESLEVGGHPLVEPFLDRLGVRELIERALGPPDPRTKLPPADSAMLLVRNFTLSRFPLYGVPEWVRRFVPRQMGLSQDQVRLVNDDRLGRTLDKLFKSDLRTLLTRLVVRMVKEFGIDLKRFHNDSTSITFSGQYDPPPPRQDGRRRLRIVRGHNKDHRPDLKQLVWSLTVSSDGAVPVHYNVFDGNVNDDRTHIETWEALRSITGTSAFLYVADSKLCSRENMEHIARRGGRFLTVLPRTRKEDARFKEWILEHEVAWKVIWDRPPLRRENDPPDRFEAVESPEPSSEGFRIVWYRSSEKWKRDEDSRDHAIQSARQDLQRLREKVGKRKLKTREQVQAKVDTILDESGARPWVKVDLSPVERHAYKQVGRGRPGKNTEYVRETSTVYEPAAKLDEESIRKSASADGIFPFITNQTDEEMSPLRLLQTYKYQPFLEKRHEQLKTAAHIVPVNFKSPERIEAFLFLYFIATTVHALLERQVRDRMRAKGLKSIPLYPEERECRAPTADKILGLFGNLRRHRLFDEETTLKTFWDELTEVQREVLDLLDVPTSAFGQ